MQHLFPDNFLSAISRFSMDIRPAPPRAAHGVHLSPRPGASLEFRDYQAYVPGDDLRRVDWAVYGRTRHLFVRRFERPTAVPVFVLVDASRSMTLETPSRYATAARLAAAIASAAVAGHNPMRVFVADGQAAPSPRAVGGRRGLVQTLANLTANRASAGPGPAAALLALLPALAAQGSGVLVLISDFFEQRGVDVLIDGLRLTPQRLVMLRVTQPWDTNPQLSGDVELQDCETDARLQVSAKAEVLARYQAAYRAYFGALDAYTTSRGVRSLRFDASTDTLGQLERLFPDGVLSL
jgi:uncharacterized protein (DUF58 family)